MFGISDLSSVASLPRAASSATAFWVGTMMSQRAAARLDLGDQLVVAGVVRLGQLEPGMRALKFVYVDGSSYCDQL